MNAIVLFVRESLQNGHLATVFVDAALKGFVLLALAGACCLCWRKASAATRHLIWFGAILGTLCFPLISWLTPAWQKPLWTVGTRLDSGNQLAVVVGLGPDRAHARAAQAFTSAAMATAPADSMHRPEAGRTRLSAELGLRWLNATMAIWGVGFLLVAALICLDRLRLGTLLRDAQRPSDDGWLSLLRELRQQLELRRSVLLLQSGHNVMPVTWGSLRPVILLPAEADQWPMERRRVVLLHELAHVRRWDCLTQFISRLACAVYWFNPGVWVASQQMCIERERACDDLVLAGGLRASEYAAHLVEIARTFSRMPRMAGIAMARSSQLRNRIASIVEASRSRPLGSLAVIAVWLVLAGAVLAIGGNQANLTVPLEADPQPLLENHLAQLRSFSAAKLRQSELLAAGDGQQISPEFRRFFDAAITGDSHTVTNMYEDFKRRHPQYSHGTNEGDVHLSTPYWSPVLEICLAFDHVIRCTPKYTELMADGVINSIPPGSIYFGGTDPGRGIPTAFSKSQIDGDPFFTLTQNALADGGYLEYLRQTYGGRIYTPSAEDSQHCFDDYLTDALRRLEHDRQFPQEAKQIRPGENVRMENGHGAVSGQVAVMSINGLLTKMIFDRNPGREFFIEESFPLDWMYPYLEPHGLIMRINRQPLAELPDEILTRDRAYWQNLVDGMIGDWLNQDTTLATVADFIRKVYVQKDLAGFSGDVSFIQNDYAKRLFSKLRSSLAGVYAWRVDHPANPAEGQRMATEADLAFRQAFVLCPYGPEPVFRYATFLSQNNRDADALVVATSAAAVDPKNSDFQNLIQRLNAVREAK
jgi:beta-lactamase regulating signal transducer with metallopeptidase domain